MKWLRRVFVLALFVGLLWVSMEFTSRNEIQVPIDLIGFQTPMIPLWGALLGAFGLGAVFAWLSVVGKVMRQGLEARRSKKTVAGLEAEIHELRNLPLAGAEGDAPAGATRLGGAPAEPGG